MPLQYFFNHTIILFWGGGGLLLSRSGRLKNRNIFKQVTEWYKTKNEKPAF